MKPLRPCPPKVRQRDAGASAGGKLTDFMPGRAHSDELLNLLSDIPVLGQSMAQVRVLRLDRLAGLAPGNKSFKLRGNLRQARRLGVRRLVSFGGAWSNHLHALAAVARDSGMESVGLVRGAERETPALEDMRAWGMQVVKLAREEYRRRNDPDYLAEISRRYAPCLVIPEGGSNAAGVAGCAEIAALVRQRAPGIARIVLPVGTGATLAGLVAGLGPGFEVVGVSALRGASDLERRVEAALAQQAPGGRARWRILHDHHCGGFARATLQLRDFIRAFEAVQGIPLEPVYTGKMLYAIYQLRRAGHWDPREPLLAIHTGGLQGRRGYAW